MISDFLQSSASMERFRSLNGTLSGSFILCWGCIVTWYLLEKASRTHVCTNAPILNSRVLQCEREATNMYFKHVIHLFHFPFDFTLYFVCIWIVSKPAPVQLVRINSRCVPFTTNLNCFHAVFTFLFFRILDPSFYGVLFCSLILFDKVWYVFGARVDTDIFFTAKSRDFHQDYFNYWRKWTCRLISSLQKQFKQKKTHCHWSVSNKKK